MTFEQALQILGIDARCDEKEARRAYLRQIKVHTPERDPDGFKRTREAYELVKASSYRLGRAESPVDQPAGFDGVQDPIPNPPDELEALRTSLYEIDDRQRRIEMARDAARRLDSGAAYELWLEQQDDDDAARAVITEGLARGHGQLRTTARLRFPSALSLGELADWYRDELAEHAFGWATLAQELVARGEIGRGVEVASQALRHPDSERAEPPSSWFCTEFGLSLFAKGALADGQRFVAACQATGLAEVSADPIRYQALLELSQVCARLPDDMCCAIARALAARDPSQADAVISSYTRGETEQGGTLLGMLEGEAPTIYSLYRHAKPPWWQGFKLNAEFGRGVWVLMILVSFLFRRCACDPEPRTQAPVQQRIRLDMGSASDWQQLSCVPSHDALCQVLLLVWNTTDCRVQQDLLPEVGREVARAKVDKRVDETGEASITRILELRLKDCSRELGAQ